MNLEQIQKLIRLANNNPNDNEANAAARRVCKMLADYKFPTPSVYGQSPINPPRTDQKSRYNPVTNPPRNTYYKPPRSREDIINEFKRKYGVSFDGFDDIFGGSWRPSKAQEDFLKDKPPTYDDRKAKTTWNQADTKEIILRSIIDVIGYDDEHKQYKYKLSCSHVVKYSAIYNVGADIRCWRCQKEKF